jgi:phage shock protein A
VSRKKSRQIVNYDVKWDQAIRDAEELLQKVENRAARLKGAIKTFTELREQGQQFSDHDYDAATQC